MWSLWPGIRFMWNSLSFPRRSELRRDSESLKLGKELHNRHQRRVDYGPRRTVVLFACYSRRGDALNQIPLACADFSFPLLPHDLVFDLIAGLGIEGVDLSIITGNSHLSV